MGLINLLEESVEISQRAPSNPLEKLKAKYTDQDVLLELESVKSSGDAELDALEAEADLKAERLKLSGGKEVFPARVLDPLSKPGIRALENVFHTVQTNWNKLPVSWNPHIQEETAEERWNRKYPEPK